MSKRHMKRQTAPTTWKVDRKGSKFIVRPNPGKDFELSMPIALIFKDVLKYCKTTKEVKTILADKEIIIDGKRRKNHRFTVGLMDVVHMPVADEQYRMMMTPGGKLTLFKIDKSEVDIKPCKISDKTKLAGGKVQFNFTDGRNVTAKDDNYKVGDTLVLKLPGQEIVKHFALSAGNYVVLSGGKYVGSHGTVEKVDGNIIAVKTGDQTVLTDKRYAFVVGAESPMIKVE